MNKMIKAWFVFAVLVAINVMAENPKEKCCAPASTPQFGELKQLIGKWEGTNTKKEKVVINYKLTAGGTALMETLFPGTPHEMVSVYHDDRGKLMMTHYCMLGNQPRLRLEDEKNGKMKFEFSDGTGIKSDNDPHMHALTVTFIDKDHFRQEWSFYDKGEEKGVETINFSRLK